MGQILYPHFFILYGPEYDCSNKTFDEWAQTGERSFTLGTLSLTIGIIVVILYCIAIGAMSCRTVLSTSCFRIMYFNCFMDVGNIALGGIATGYFFLEGTVYCMHPKMIGAMGSFGFAFWMSACFNCIAIAINRCCMMSDSFVALSRDENYIYWILSSSALFIFCCCFTRPPLFNSKNGAWFIQPFIRDFFVEMSEVTNYLLSIGNVVTSFAITGLYITLCTYLWMKKSESHQERNKQIQRKVFIQSLFICIPTCLTCYGYCYMQLFAVSEWVIIGSTIAYQASSAIPVFVYLVLNRTIRERAVWMFLGRGPTVAGTYQSGSVGIIDSRAPQYINAARDSGGKVQPMDSTD